MSQPRDTFSRTAHATQLPESIFDRGDSAVLVIDQRGRIRYANAAISSLLRRPRSEILQAHLEAILPPDRSFLGHACSLALTSRTVTTTFGWDTMLMAWIGVRIYPIAAGIEAHIRTISSHLGDGDAAGDSSTDVSLSLDAVTIPMQIIDTEGVVQFANQATLSLLGYTREEYVGRPMQHVFLQPDDARRLIDGIQRHEALQDFETELLQRNGHVRTVQITTGSHDSREGRILIQCYLHDVTDQRAGEEREARLAALVEASDDAIIAKRLDGVITSWNPGAERIYGYTAEEAIGQPVTLIIPNDREDDFPEIMGKLAQGERIDHYETIRQTKDGRLLDVSVSIAPIRNRSGRIIGASTIGRDITERRMLERKQREFLTMVAHDLRSPLTSIKGFSQLMQRREAYSPSAIEAILAQVQHMERLVGDVLDITRIDEHRQDLALADTDLTAVARDVIAGVSDMRHSGEFHLITPDDTPIIGRWDARRLAQVLDNLVSNAVKYAPYGDIRITLEPLEDHVTIEVADDGPGIAPEYLPNIFERFFRIPGEHSMGRGVGLGLAIVKGLVEAHGGTISVESVLGEGTTFSIDLPREVPTSALELHMHANR